MAVFEGKVAFVTGGAGGIGFAIIKELLSNGALGVSIVDVVEETGLAAVKQIEENFGPNKAIFIKTDVSDKTQLEEAFEKTVKKFKQLDIVFNNAGIFNESKWEKMIAINLNGVVHGSFLAMEKYLPKYKSGDEGVIVNTASLLGLKTYQSVPVYSATKYGVIGLGRSLGGNEYYKKYKVRVLTLCPGLIKTPLSQNIGQEICPFFDLLKEEIQTQQDIAEEPEFIAKSLSEIFKKGKNGSVWVAANGDPPYEVPLPVLKKQHKQ